MIVWNGEKLLEVREVAELLGRTAQHVYGLISQGRLARRIGADGRIRIGESELDDFFGSSRKGKERTASSRKSKHQKALEELRKKGL